MKNEIQIECCVLSNVAGTPTCDLSKYREQLGDVHPDPTAADEFLKILWSIACSFVELGFDVETIKDLPFMQEFASAASANKVKQCEIHKEAGQTPRQRKER